jgi:hypothetical protein
MVDLRKQPSPELEEHKPVLQPQPAHDPPVPGPKPEIHIRRDEVVHTTFGHIKNAVGRVAGQSADTLRLGALAAASYAWGVLEYFGHLTRIFLQYMQKPFGGLLFICTLFTVVRLSSVHLPYTVLAPMCAVPQVPAFLPICSQIPSHMKKSFPYKSGSPPPVFDFPSLVKLQGSAFEPLLKSTAGYSALSLELQHAELAIEDLITLVHISDLPSREAIVMALGGFVERARNTGRALHEYNTHVGSSVDNVLAINEFAAKQIDAASDTSVVSKIMGWKTKDEVAATTFKQAMDFMVVDVRDLVVEGESIRQDLETLKTQLKTLSAMLHRDGAVIDKDLDVLLSSLWTMLGGNQMRVRSMQRNVSLLQKLGSYRDRARLHIENALNTLSSMHEDIRSLRRKVTAPALEGDHGRIQVQIDAIQMGARRLRQRQLEAQRVGEEEKRKVHEAAKG